jgi:hypothetical protein
MSDGDFWNDIRTAVQGGMEAVELATHGAVAPLARWAGPLGAVLGGMEVKDGIDELDHARNVEQGNDAWYKMLKGGGETAAGIGQTTGNPYLAAGGTAFSLGVMGGHYLDKATTELNAFGNDEAGKPQGLTDWGANNGVKAEQWARRQGWGETAQTATGIAGTLGSMASASLPEVLARKLLGGGKP